MKLSALITAALLSFTVAYAVPTNETVTLNGTKVQLIGNKINVNDTAPVVKLLDVDLREVSVGGKTKKTQILLVVPSFDTPVCDLEIRTFNEKAAALPNVEITVISMDLPFAGQRYCAAHGIKNINVASDFQNKTFGKTYGTLIGSSAMKGLETRAIFVIKNGKVIYKQLVPEITQAPDYDAVLKAL